MCTQVIIGYISLFSNSFAFILYIEKVAFNSHDLMHNMEIRGSEYSNSNFEGTS